MNKRMKETLQRARNFGMHRWQSIGCARGFIIMDLANKALVSGDRLDISRLYAWSQSWRSAERERLRRYIEEGKA